MPRRRRYGPLSFAGEIFPRPRGALFWKRRRNGGATCILTASWFARLGQFCRVRFAATLSALARRAQRSDAPYCLATVSRRFGCDRCPPRADLLGPDEQAEWCGSSASRSGLCDHCGGAVEEGRRSGNRLRHHAVAGRPRRDSGHSPQLRSCQGARLAACSSHRRPS